MCVRSSREVQSGGELSRVSRRTAPERQALLANLDDPSRRLLLTADQAASAKGQRVMFKDGEKAEATMVGRSLDLRFVRGRLLSGPDSSQASFTEAKPKGVASSRTCFLL